jgi:hypothetical protein
MLQYFLATCRVCLLPITTALALALTAQAQTGPVSTYYLTQYTGGGPGAQLFVINGTTVTTTAANLDFAAPIAVSGTTVRTAGFNPSAAGNIYDLAGNPTGGTATLPNGLGNVYDATSDGLSNYFVDFSLGTVFRSNLDFSNPVQLTGAGFNNLGSGNFLGSTFDPTNNSLWISGWGAFEVRNISLVDGTVLSSFVPHNLNGTALQTMTSFARDPLTDTLWMGAPSQNLFFQFSKSGVLLQTVSIPAIGGAFLLGGEFLAVPEPSTYALLALGFGGVIWFRRRRA